MYMRKWPNICHRLLCSPTRPEPQFHGPKSAIWPPLVYKLSVSYRPHIVQCTIDLFLLLTTLRFIHCLFAINLIRNKNEMQYVTEYLELAQHHYFDCFFFLLHFNYFMLGACHHFQYTSHFMKRSAKGHNRKKNRQQMNLQKSVPAVGRHRIVDVWSNQTIADYHA